MEISRDHRTITILPRLTGAKTQYYDISAEDEAYIYDWLIRFLADASELATHDEDLRREWFRRRPKLYPRGRQGPNSMASMIGGMISARIANPRHNISDAQLESLEQIFDTIRDLYYNDDVNNPGPQTIRFRRQLFEQ